MQTRANGTLFVVVQLVCQHVCQHVPVLTVFPFSITSQVVAHLEAVRTRAANCGVTGVPCVCVCVCVCVVSVLW